MQITFLKLASGHAQSRIKEHQLAEITFKANKLQSAAELCLLPESRQRRAGPRTALMQLMSVN